MKRFKSIFYLAIMLVCIAGVSNAQYWFQFGTRADLTASNNNGVSAMIKTLIPQNGVTSGSLAFWVGEDLSDGSFVQVGYVIENQTGYYPQYCDISGCSGRVFINAGDPEWFYEYFLPGQQAGFLGALGSDNSAGANGTINNYSLFSQGDAWFFEVNGNIVGHVTLNVPGSGQNVPVAFGEVANTSTNSQYIIPVAFQNFSFYKSGRWLHVSNGYSYIGYGVVSEEAIKNPYGVKEVNNQTDYFMVGSGIKQVTDYTQLWSTGYVLRISSQYGNLNSSEMYNAYSTVGINAPSMIQISGNSRVVFGEWKGSGSGSYSGPLQSTLVTMNSNINETALWQQEYLLNISGGYGDVSGSGWYGSGSVATYAVVNKTVYLSSTQREVFEGWSNGNMNASGTVTLHGPMNIYPEWKNEYYVNATSQFSNVTGSGWYQEGDTATLSVQNTTRYYGTGERYLFSNWSTGQSSSSINVEVLGHESYIAYFKNQYLVNLNAQDQYGNLIHVQEFEIGNNTFSNQTFLDANQNYTIRAAYYKGVRLMLDYNIRAQSPKTESLKLPVYNVEVNAQDLLFGFPVNASINAKFANGTTQSFYTGRNGSVLLQDVPYGYVNGTVTLLFNQGIYAGNGANLSLRPVSAIDLIVILIVIIIIVAYSRVRRRRRLQKLESQ